MDSRAHGESGGEIATYGWKERYDTVSIVNGLYSTESVHHLYAMGVSMGASIALQSAAVEPRIDGVIAEDPFADLREVSYDYAGLRTSPLLGKTLFRPASIFAINSLAQAGGFSPDQVSPEKAVAARPFPVFLICGTRDHTIPCRATRASLSSRLDRKNSGLSMGRNTHLPSDSIQRNTKNELFSFSSDPLKFRKWIPCVGSVAASRTG